jgi:hypothetical protein
MKLVFFLKSLKCSTFPLERQRPTAITKYYEVFDVRPKNIEHLTFFL